MPTPLGEGWATFQRVVAAARRREGGDRLLLVWRGTSGEIIGSVGIYRPWCHDNDNESRD